VKCITAAEAASEYKIRGNPMLPRFLKTRVNSQFYKIQHGGERGCTQEVAREPRRVFIEILGLGMKTVR
jgi:hypothetical protein